MDETEIERRRAELIEKIEDGIGRVGVFVIATWLEEERVPMNYTIGMQEASLPELVILGVDQNVGHAVLNAAARKMRETGEALPEHQRLDKLIDNLDVVAVRLDPARAAEFLKLAAQRAENKELAFSAMQLVWPDPQNRLPWEPGFDTRFNAYQPMLTPETPTH